jgi:hypothetical protein
LPITCIWAVEVSTSIPPTHHRLQEVPALVRHQFQEALIDGGQGDFPARRQRPALRALHPDIDLCLVPHLVTLLVRRDPHLQLVGAPTHLDLREPELERRLSEIDKRGRLDTPDAPAHRQHRDEDIGRVVALDGHLDHRRLPRQRPDKVLDHALALDAHKRRGLAERHAYLKDRGVAGLVTFLLGEEVHAVLVTLFEPPVPGLRHPHLAVRVARVAVGVDHSGAQDEVAVGRRFGLAHEQPLVVGLAGTQRPDALDLAMVLKGIETADQTLAVRVGDAREHIDLDLGSAHRPALEIEDQRLGPQPFAAQRPAVRLQADHEACGPQLQMGRGREPFAVRVLVFQFGQDILRRLGSGQVLELGAHGTRPVQGQGLGGERRHAVLGLALLGVGVLRLLALRDVPVREFEALKVRKGHAPGPH